MEHFTNSLATLTGGSGAVAVLVTDGSFRRDKRRRLLGGDRLRPTPQYSRSVPLGPAKRNSRRRYKSAADRFALGGRAVRGEQHTGL